MAGWFGPKEPGFELGIRAWQGYAATALFVALLIGVHFFPFEDYGWPLWVGDGASLGVVLLFLLLVYFKYERD